jgi:hypothetical protein
LVDLDLAGDTLSVQRRAKEDVGQLDGTAVLKDELVFVM